MPATVWKGYLSFGLVSFPVRLFAAARAETVHFHLLHKKDRSRVRESGIAPKRTSRLSGLKLSKATRSARANMSRWMTRS
jgi:non-homologous end joining protein Ku